METLEEVLRVMNQDLKLVRDEIKAEQEGRTGRSRWVGPGASESFVEKVARGESYNVREPGEFATKRHDTKQAGGGLSAHLKALAEGTGSAGGFLVPPQWADEVLTLLRARSCVYAMGPRTIPVAKLLSVVSLSTGATAYYTAENAAITPSEPTFAEAALLSPRELTALVPVSNRLLRDADNPSIDEVVRADLAEVLALRADLAFLRGTGAGVEPVGIRNKSGITVTELGSGNGETPDFDDLKDVVARLRSVNAPFRNPGWIMHPRTLAGLEKITDGVGHYLGQEAGLLSFDQTGGGGRLLGFPFRTSTQIPVNLTTGTSTDTSELYFSSDWQECWIGENSDFTIEVSSDASYTADGGTTWISAFQNRQTLFRSVWGHDLGLRRPALFTVVTGIKPLP